MTALEVGQELVTLVRDGKDEEILERLYDPNILSVEAAGENPESRGVEAIRAKWAWWNNAMEVKSMKVQGPFPHGEQFAVIYDFETVEKESGKPIKMEEVALYTVKDGKIVEERFFYNM
jgi:ketosteroid isomerase-like protein